MSPAILAAVAASSLLNLASAQQASYAFFGSLSGPAFYGQHLTVSGSPRLGTTFSVAVAYGAPPGGCPNSGQSWAVWLLTGFSNRFWGSLPLPAQLGQGFTLLVSPDVIQSQTLSSHFSCPPGWASGAAPSFSMVVPNITGLLGVRAYQQILLAGLDWSGGLMMPPLATDGGILTIGL